MIEKFHLRILKTQVRTTPRATGSSRQKKRDGLGKATCFANCLSRVPAIHARLKSIAHVLLPNALSFAVRFIGVAIA